MHGPLGGVYVLCYWGVPQNGKKDNQAQLSAVYGAPFSGVNGLGVIGIKLSNSTLKKSGMLRTSEGWFPPLLVGGKKWLLMP